MKRLLILLIAIGFVSFGICVKAETVDIKFDSGELQIPSAVENKLEDITINDYEGLMERTTPNNIFTEIIALFKSGFKKPFATAMSIIALLIVISVLNSFKPDNKTTDFVLTIGVIPVTFAANLEPFAAASAIEVEPYLSLSPLDVAVVI